VPLPEEEAPTLKAFSGAGARSEGPMTTQQQERRNAQAVVNKNQEPTAPHVRMAFTGDGRSRHRAVSHARWKRICRQRHSLHVGSAPSPAWSTWSTWSARFRGSPRDREGRPARPARPARPVAGCRRATSGRCSVPSQQSRHSGPGARSRTSSRPALRASGLSVVGTSRRVSGVGTVPAFVVAVVGGTRPRARRPAPGTPAACQSTARCLR
jgi:hypothetical protein